tara:strand:+ start:1219 stop:2112 length:894 start_codon:yes stop_codon:yes gene_type:complete
MSKKIDGLYTANDLYDSVMDLYSGKSHVQYKTGFDSLDPFLKIVKPCFTVITGTPNSGKSSFCYDLAMNLAKNEGFKFVIFSPEHSLAVNVKRLVEKYTKKPFDKMFKNRLKETELGEALVFIEDHFFFMDKIQDSPDIDWIVDRAYWCAENLKIDCLIIDPYNEINPNRNNGFREDEHISVVISKIKRFNRETDTMSFLVAHPNKQIRNPDGKFVVDSLYSISGSAHFNNKADIGIIVTRDFELQQTDIRIAKVREIDVYGNIGSITLKWNPKQRCYNTLEEYENNFTIVGGNNIF